MPSCVRVLRKDMPQPRSKNGNGAETRPPRARNRTTRTGGLIQLFSADVTDAILDPPKTADVPQASSAPVSAPRQPTAARDDMLTSHRRSRPGKGWLYGTWTVSPGSVPRPRCWLSGLFGDGGYGLSVLLAGSAADRVFSYVVRSGSSSSKTESTLFVPATCFSRNAIAYRRITFDCSSFAPKHRKSY